MQKMYVSYSHPFLNFPAYISKVTTWAIRTRIPKSHVNAAGKKSLNLSQGHLHIRFLPTHLLPPWHPLSKSLSRVPCPTRPPASPPAPAASAFSSPPARALSAPEGYMTCHHGRFQNLPTFIPRIPPRRRLPAVL